MVKISQFLQEFKRRKVFRVIAMYAASAFILLEVVDIITPALLLPPWTVTLVVVLLAIGFPFAVIFSWIFDITPEGVQKTKPVSKVVKQPIEKPANVMGWKIATYMSVLIIIGLLIVNILGGKKKEDDLSELEKSIAVLPFKNFSVDPNQEYMCDGLTDEIINHLFKIKSFEKVVSLNSVLTYKGTTKRIPDIANELDVNYILEGTYKKIGDQIRVTAQLIEPINDKHIWQNEYDQPFEEIITIQTDIALKIASELMTVLSPNEIKQLEKRPTENFEAYSSYLRGNFFLHKAISGESYNKAIEFFENAIHLDSTYSKAYVGLAQCYTFMVRYSVIPRSEGHPMAKKNILKAIELDESLGEAHAVLGLLMLILDWDIYGPEQEFLKAISLSPNSSEVYSLYAQYLFFIGRYDKGLLISERAVELDPITPYTNIWPGAFHFFSGHYDESINHFKNMLALESNYVPTYVYLSYNYALKGMKDEAVYYADKSLSIGNTKNDPMIYSYLGWVYAISGELNKANELLIQLQELYKDKKRIFDPIWIAVIQAGLGEHDKAFEWLNMTYEVRSGGVIFLNAFSDPFFKNLSSDPRYTKLLEKIGFKK